MAVKYISKVLREFYEDWARKDLDFIAFSGLKEILNPGAKEEIGFLMQFEALSSYEIKRAQYEYLVNTLWGN